MFTGIIEETGRIKSFRKDSNGAEIEIFCSKILEGIKIGDSICVNGVCQTVTDFFKNSFAARLSGETLSVTTFADADTDDTVNLERALTLSTRLGGHIVTGHVDCRGKFHTVRRLSDFYDLTFEIPQEQTKYVVKKGSIAVNGISLTVAEIENNIFKTAIIPHTYENTSLKTLNTGDYVNIETDILGKYVEKFLSADDNENGITMEFLEGNGFI